MTKAPVKRKGTSRVKKGACRQKKRAVSSKSSTEAILAEAATRFSGTLERLAKK